MNKEEQVISGFRDLFNKLACLNKSKMEKCLKGYKPSEIHFIEYIAKNVDCNVTKLADSFYMTRGAISKLSKKLMENGLILNLLKKERQLIRFMMISIKSFKSVIKLSLIR